MANDANESAPSAFRSFLPDLSTPRFTHMKTQDTHEYSNEFIANGNPPWLHGLYLHWRELLTEPFKGVTNDGTSWERTYCAEDWATHGIALLTIGY